MNTSYCSRAHLGMCSGINNPIAFMTSKSHIVHEHISGCARAFITHCMLILHFNMVCGLIGRILPSFRDEHISGCAQCMYCLNHIHSYIYLI